MDKDSVFSRPAKPQIFHTQPQPPGTDLSKMLKAEEIDAAHQRVLNALSEKAGVRFR
jgi:hypothetical protein